jgi:hypothetical protein
MDKKLFDDKFHDTNFSEDMENTFIILSQLTD